MEDANFMKGNFIALPKINDKTSGLGANKKRPFKRQPTIKGIAEWIGEQEYPDNIKEQLVLKAQSYPQGALESFIKNIDKHVNMLLIKSKKST